MVTPLHRNTILPLALLSQIRHLIAFASRWACIKLLCHVLVDKFLSVVRDAAMLTCSYENSSYTVRRLGNLHGKTSREPLSGTSSYDTHTGTGTRQHVALVCMHCSFGTTALHSEQSKRYIHRVRCISMQLQGPYALQRGLARPITWLAGLPTLLFVLNSDYPIGRAVVKIHWRYTKPQSNSPPATDISIKAGERNPALFAPQ